MNITCFILWCCYVIVCACYSVMVLQLFVSTITRHCEMESVLHHFIVCIVCITCIYGIHLLVVYILFIAFLFILLISYIWLKYICSAICVSFILC